MVTKRGEYLPLVEFGRVYRMANYHRAAGAATIYLMRLQKLVAPFVERAEVV